MPDAEALHRTAGAIAVTVGVGASLAPSLLLRPFGIPARDVTGAAELGWRMFGIRTALIGGAMVRGHAGARAALVPVQLADQLVFARSARTGDVPLRAARLAQGVSGVLIALGVAAAARER